MTRTESERLAVVEDKVDDIKERMERIESKLDDAIACKADKSEVQAVEKALAEKASAEDFKEMRKVLLGVLLSIAAFLAVTLIGIVLVATRLQ